MHGGSGEPRKHVVMNTQSASLIRWPGISIKAAGAGRGGGSQALHWCIELMLTDTSQYAADLLDVRVQGHQYAGSRSD